MCAAPTAVSQSAPQRLLFAPGPTTAEERVCQAMAQPIVGFRDPYFLECMTVVQQGLREAFGTTSEKVFALPGTGSSGMEAAIANFVQPGTKLVVFANGYFADRQSEMGKRHGAEVIRFEKEWGEVFSAEEAEAFVSKVKPDVVAFVHAETSTGACQDIAAITAAAKKVGALVIADCVTSLGAMPIQFAELGIDVAYSCTQKGLSCPAGLSPIAVSPRACASDG